MSEIKAKGHPDRVNDVVIALEEDVHGLTMSAGAARYDRMDKARRFSSLTRQHGTQNETE